jgi:hypothetical protein
MSFSTHLRISRFAVTVNVTAGSVLPCEADPLRRPQRPGKPARVFTLSGTLPVIHPRESLGTVVRFTMHWPNAELSRLRESNVPETRTGLKRKLYCFCAEAVDVRDLLWKVRENKEPATNDLQLALANVQLRTADVQLCWSRTNIFSLTRNSFVHRFGDKGWLIACRLHPAC